MNLLLFRHGPAGKADAARWPDDRARPLTRRGVKRTTLAAHGIARLLGEIDVVVTSPLVRAAETARLLAEAFETDNLQTLDALSPGGSERKVIEFLNRQGSHQCVALVGHEPSLGRLAATLVAGTGMLPLKKAGACVLRCDDEVRSGQAELIWFIPPTVLRRIGRKRVHA